MTPPAASRPKALPPEKEQTVDLGDPMQENKESVCLVPEADPRMSIPATAP